MIEGKYKNKLVHSYVLENEYLKVEVMNLGATLVSFVDKIHDCDMVLGFEDLETYLTQHGSYLGATVGRCANRIAKGCFKLHDCEYHVPINNGPNSLHGGNDNFFFQVYDVQELDHAIEFSYHSKNGEEGYPGNLDLKITYEIDGKNLFYKIEGLSDQDTILNITNHSYFNLSNGATDILDHKLKIYTDRVAMVDENGLTKDEVINVKGTDFDFREFKPIREAVNSNHPNIVLARGLDHNFVFENFDEKLVAELCYKDRHLKVTSDLPGMHIYTANYLDGEVRGKKGRYYKEHDGVCFECQYYPNAINYENYLKPILYKNQKMQHFIKYTIV